MSEPCFPDRIYISGNPLLWKGFDGWYTINKKSPIITDLDKVEYRQEEHDLKIMGVTIPCFRIRPTRIVRDPNAKKELRSKWILILGDHPYAYVNPVHISPDGKLFPIGDWGTILITQNEDSTTWWRSYGWWVLNANAIFVAAAAYYWFLI